MFRDGLEMFRCARRIFSIIRETLRARARQRARNSETFEHEYEHGLVDASKCPNDEPTFIDHYTRMVACRPSPHN